MYRISVFRDWPICLAAPGACILGIMLLVVPLVSQQSQGQDIPFYVCAAFFVLLTSVVVWRALIIWRINRGGITVEADITKVTGTNAPGRADIIVHAKYAWQGREVETYF